MSAPPCPRSSGRNQTVGTLIRKVTIVLNKLCLFVFIGAELESGFWYFNALGTCLARQGNVLPFSSERMASAVCVLTAECSSERFCYLNKHSGFRYLCLFARV